VTANRTPDVMERLEKTIERLADGAAPLDELVAAHQEALRLLEEADAELDQLRRRTAELTESLNS
jgi:exodeoxyribonuclease VII small subunit